MGFERFPDFSHYRDLSSEGFADPVVGEGRVLQGRHDLRHVATRTVLRAYGAGRACVIGDWAIRVWVIRVWVIGGRFCAGLIDVTLQTA